MASSFRTKLAVESVAVSDVKSGEKLRPVTIQGCELNGEMFRLAGWDYKPPTISADEPVGFDPTSPRVIRRGGLTAGMEWTGIK